MWVVVTIGNIGGGFAVQDQCLFPFCLHGIAQQAVQANMERYRLGTVCGYFYDHHLVRIGDKGSAAVFHSVRFVGDGRQCVRYVEFTIQIPGFPPRQLVEHQVCHRQVTGCIRTLCIGFPEFACLGIVSAVDSFPYLWQRVRGFGVVPVLRIARPDRFFVQLIYFL